MSKSGNFEHPRVIEYVKSVFGSIIFCSVLLLYALTSNPIIQWAFGFRPFGLGPFAVLPDIFTFVALAILFYLTMKY